MNGFKVIVDGFAFTQEKTAQKACQEADGIQYVKDRLDLKNPQMVLQMYRKLLAEEVFETPVGLVYLKDLQEYLFRSPEVDKKEIEPIPVLQNFERAEDNARQTLEAKTRSGNRQPQGSIAGNGSQKQFQAESTENGNQKRLLAESAENGNQGQLETLDWYVEKLEECKRKERLAEHRRARAEEQHKKVRKNLRASLLCCLFLAIVAVGIAAVTLTDNQPNILNYENKIIEKYQDWEADLESREQALKEKELGN